MKRLIFIILISVIVHFVYSNDRTNGWKNQNFKLDIKDTVEFEKPFILQGGDTCSIFMVDDSICMSCNGGDTLRIDGGRGAGDLSWTDTLTDLGTKYDADTTLSNAHNYADSLFFTGISSLTDNSFIYKNTNDKLYNVNWFYVWSNPTITDSAIRIFRQDTLSALNVHNLYSYLPYSGFGIVNKAIVTFNQMSYSYRYATSIAGSLEAFPTIDNPDPTHQGQFAVYGKLQTNGDPVYIGHPTGKCIFAGVSGRVDETFNDTTNGGTYILAGVLGQDQNDGDAVSYGVYSDGDLGVNGNITGMDTIEIDVATYNRLISIYDTVGFVGTRCIDANCDSAYLYFWKNGAKDSIMIGGSTAAASESDPIYAADSSDLVRFSDDTTGTNKTMSTKYDDDTIQANIDALESSVIDTLNGSDYFLELSDTNSTSDPRWLTLFDVDSIAGDSVHWHANKSTLDDIVAFDIGDTISLNTHDSVTAGSFIHVWDSVAHAATQNINFHDTSCVYIYITGTETINVTGLPSGVSTLFIEQNGTGYAITKGTGWGTLIGTGTISATADEESIVQFIRVVFPGGSEKIRHMIISD